MFWMLLPLLVMALGFFKLGVPTVWTGVLEMLCQACAELWCAG